MAVATTTMQLFTLSKGNQKLNMTDVMRDFGLSADEVDTNMGLVKLIDSDLYMLRVCDEAAQKIYPSEQWSVHGPFRDGMLRAAGAPRLRGGSEQRTTTFRNKILSVYQRLRLKQ